MKAVCKLGAAVASLILLLTAAHAADDKTYVMKLGTATINGKTIVSTTFETRQRKYTIYAAKDGGGLHLLGISPALDRAVPPENRRSEGASTKASTNGSSPKATL